MTWWLPAFAFVALAFIGWDLRDVRSGTIHLRFHEIDRAAAPLTFGFALAVHVISIMLLIVFVVLWTADYNGLRSEG